jgi:hypothetical protein
MGTRSLIGIQETDGSIEAVYCHWDGYPEYNGKVLYNHYPEPKIRGLLALGDLSSLRESIEKPEGHTFNTAVDGYSIFYNRDRGEELSTGKKWPDAEAYKNEEGYGTEWHYYYSLKDHKWYVSKCWVEEGEEKAFKELTPAMWDKD